MGRVVPVVLVALASIACVRDPAPDLPIAMAAAAFEQVRDDPAALREFLVGMPLGGDLHHHASGGVRPEVLIRFAAEDGLCLPRDPAVAWILATPPCADDFRPVADALGDPPLQREIERRWSMQDYLADDPGIDRVQANEYFFSTFAMTRLVRDDFGRLLAAVRSLAAEDGVVYLETAIGVNPDPSALDALIESVDWQDDLRAMHAEIRGNPHLLRARDASVDGMEHGLERSEEILGCGTERPQSGCAVFVRLQRIFVRTAEPATVFANMVLGYEIARASPIVVGVDFAGPETHPIAVRDYDTHMRMFGLMAELYPDVALTLHAGEMTANTAADLDAGDHLSLAITPAPRGAAARRIGHAVALDAEADREAVLATMRNRGVAVEVNLESNRQLLGTDPRGHPFLQYLRADVPIVLSTDDPGPMFSDLAQQFELAAGSPEVDYPALRAAAFNSIAYSFLPALDKQRLLRRLAADYEQFEASFVR